jgi:hypothetical protein
MGLSRIDARTLRPRPPLVVADALGTHQPVGRLAVGADAVWTQATEDRRVWRVPLAGGPARAVARLSGLAYGLAADEGAVWVLSGTGDPGNQSDPTGRLRRLDQRTGTVTATTPLPDLAASLAVGPILPGDRVVPAPARLRPGCARRRSARSVGGHRGARAPSRGPGVAGAKRRSCSPSGTVAADD